MKTLKSLLIICGLFSNLLFIGCDELFEEPWETYQVFTVNMKNQSNFKANLWMNMDYSDSSGEWAFHAEGAWAENEVASLGSRSKKFNLIKYSKKDDDLPREYFGSYYVTVNGTLKASLEKIKVNNSSSITLVWTGAELKIE